MLYAIGGVKREVSKRCRDMLVGRTGSFTIDEYFEKSGSYVKWMCYGISCMCENVDNSNLVEGKLYQSFIDELIVAYDTAKIWQTNSPDESLRIKTKQAF